MKLKTTTLSLLLLTTAGTAAGQTNVFKNAHVRASSVHTKYAVENAVDGVLSRKSTWMSETGSRPPHILEIDLPRYYDIDSIVLYTGIPEAEKNANEKIQSAGFWSVKNFLFQYWDDANWTDISETLTTENREYKVVFRFPTPITSFRFRLYSTDGEAIRIVELEGYGKMNSSLAPPTGAALESTLTLRDENRSRDVHVKVSPEVTGRSMQYVGYNQGYLVPGYNASGWIEYSEVNSVRIWADLQTYAKAEWVDDRSDVQSLADFERLKNELRADPQNAPAIRWDSIAAAASRTIPSTNTMCLDYALAEMNRLGIDVVIQSGVRISDTGWKEKWSIWQRYYMEAFYLAKTAGVHLLAMQNEPNHRHAGPVPLDTWIEMMRIASDAFRSAVWDVNRIYGKNLDPQFVGPVTAGTNTNWWSKIAAAERVDYKGEPTGYDLISLFSTHSYNLPAAGYAGKTENIDKILRDNHPLGLTKPIGYTEIGRWMNAYLIDKEETMDSPSLFTEWAGVYTHNMKGGAYGMWAFKFANTASSTYPRGIKSGHHHIWKGRRFAEDRFENLALNKPVRVSGTDSGYAAARITDGDKSDASAWAFTSPGEKWAEIDLESLQAVGGLVVYTGSAYGVFTAPDRIRSIRIEGWDGSAWQALEKEEESRYAQLFYPFEDAVRVSKIRITAGDEGKTIIREVKVFGPQTLSAAEESFDVSGVQRTAQVVRLFAKGFKNRRPLLDYDIPGDDPDLDVAVSVDSLAGNIYVWLVQRNPVDYRLTLDLGPIGIGADVPVAFEQVGHTKYGEASLLTTGAGGKLSLELPQQSVGLLTIGMNTRPAGEIRAARTAVVRGGREAGKNFRNEQPAVSLDSREGSENRVTYLRFDLSRDEISRAGRILLGVHGDCDGDTPFRFHVYGMSGPAWSEETICWNNAPLLDPDEPRIERVGEEAFVAGELTMTAQPGYHYLDVTDAVKKQEAQNVTFVLVREVREPGDDYDKGRTARISSRRDPHPPVLITW